MAASILKSKRFLPLMLTQFFGALNDNLFKNALLITVTLTMASKAAILSNIIAALFILPFFLFSATAGEIADKYDKSKIARLLKITELILMLDALFIYQQQSIWGLIILLFLMGTQSTFFGPVKYALLPQHLQTQELALGNAYIEATTYFAILLGLILGTLLNFEAVLYVLVIFALIGYTASIFIPKAPSYQPNTHIHKNIYTSFMHNFQIIRKNKTIFRCILGATWFWMVGAFVVVQIYPLSGNVLHVSNTVITFFLMLFSIGVAVGSVFCGHLMKGFIHATYTPLSALMMGVCFYMLYLFTNNYPTPDAPVSLAHFFSAPHSIGICLSLFVLAFFGGLYIVPLNTLMQRLSPKTCLASIIGGNNILNALGMTLISVFAVILLSVGFNIAELFLCVAILSTFVCLYISALLPHAFWRSLLRTIFELCFKVQIKGANNMIKAGKKVLFVANHTSLLDGLLLAAFTQGDITFAVNTTWAEKRIMKFFAHFVDFAPLNPTNPMSMRALISQVKAGKRVMIFPEGRITTTGGLMKIYEGAGMIALKTGARIVPVRISGATESKFSYLKNKIKTKHFPKIEMSFLKPRRLTIPDNLSRREQRHNISLQLYDLMTDSFYQTALKDEHIFNSLIKAAQKHGVKHKIAEDINRKPLTYGALIKKSYILGEAFIKICHQEKYIGLLLPNSLANLVCFYALQSIDKVPVMLNFSHGLNQFNACLKTLNLQIVVTSRAFIEKARLEHLQNALETNNIRIIYLEDFAKQISLISKCRGLFKYIRHVKPENAPSETAVVLFTSGSEGLPKAVLLSHKNIQANRFQILSVLAVNSSDVFFNALPMFHSFGLTVGTVVTTLSGVKTFFYPSPLHYRIVPELIYDTNTTIVCGTDTFFYGYARMGNPYDFFALKYAIVGGEKLKERTAELFMKKFGVRILEGYGTTETAPVLTLNTPMHFKEATVGRFLPGIEHRLITSEGIQTGYLLEVKADNVMQGYMKPDNPLVLQTPQDGWYVTGDIVDMDKDGFITILGRQKRFAKIAGEMVSLTSVEETLEKLYPNAKQGIIAVSDDKKGEKLVLITNEEKADLAEIKAFFKEQNFNELWCPKQVIYTKNPPLLGNGKFDYQQALKLAQA